MEDYEKEIWEILGQNQKKKHPLAKEAGTFFLCVLIGFVAVGLYLFFTIGPQGILSILTGLPQNQYIAPYISQIISGGRAQPTGIGAFGIYNDSGKIVPYSVETNYIQGSASINQIFAYNQTPPEGISSDGASLQLNAMLVITNLNSSEEIFLIQNIVGFETNSDVLYYNPTVVSWRSFTSCGSWQSSTYTYNGKIENFCILPGNDIPYTLPLSLKLELGLSIQLGVGVTISYLINGADLGSFLVTDNEIKNATFLTSGYSTYNIGNGSVDLYDTELIFGGEGDGEATYFNSLNASLKLSYLNSTNNSFVEFPSFYSFGTDVVEAADNLNVTSIGNGYYKVYNATRPGLRYLE